MLKNEPARRLVHLAGSLNEFISINHPYHAESYLQKTDNQCPHLWTLMWFQPANPQSFTMRSINMIRSWRILKPDMTLFGMSGFMG